MGTSIINSALSSLSAELLIIYIQGKWNGFGGKVEPGEKIIDAAVRNIYTSNKLLIITSITSIGIVVS